jgi:hypothetical protein
LGELLLLIPKRQKNSTKQIHQPNKNKFVKTKILLTTFVSTFCLLHSAFGQGVLAPPGAPAPTMKSLAQIEPRKPISALPANLTTGGSYYLTASLTGTGGITINSSDTTVDLAGFAINGGGAAGSGILINGGLKNIVIRNGTIRGWSASGVLSSSSLARNLDFAHLKISDSGQSGITAVNAVISDCSISSSGGAGIAATACTILNCAVDDSFFQGMVLYATTVSHCSVQHSGSDGIGLEGAGCVIHGTVISGNNTDNVAVNAGLYINSINHRIENNQFIGNGAAGYGILANGSPAGVLVIKNFVSGNGVRNYGISAPIIFGPIITATGPITNSNPWANFSY